jgi:hypothetical protein
MKYKIVYEMHALPLEGVVLTRARIVQAQLELPPSLGRIVVAMREGSTDDFALSVLGVWKELPAEFRSTHVPELIRRLENDEDGGTVEE